MGCGHGFGCLVVFCPAGAAQASPGQRPGKRVTPVPALKGRHKLCSALSGLGLSALCPRGVAPGWPVPPLRGRKLPETMTASDRMRFTTWGLLLAVVAAALALACGEAVGTADTAHATAFT